jgi:hypothetical protein
MQNNETKTKRLIVKIPSWGTQNFDLSCKTSFTKIANLQDIIKKVFPHTRFLFYANGILPCTLILVIIYLLKKQIFIH